MPVSFTTSAEYDALAVRVANLETRVSALETPPPPPPAAKTLLAQADFTFLGGYSIPANLEPTCSLAYSQGFAIRRVNGHLRFLTLAFVGNVAGPQFKLVEFAPPESLGGTVTQITNSWPDIFAGIDWNHNSRWHGLAWDEAKQKLWTTSAIDYPDTAHLNDTETILLRTLGSNPTGPWGLQGVGQRRIYGGMTPVPQWFQSQYGVGPYAVGFGGYASLAAQGLGVALGPTLYAIPDPEASPATITAFKTLMDQGVVTASDWYASGVPTTFDRGVRNPHVQNYFDGGDPRPNPQTPPTVPPQAGAQWLSPAPDGLGRWVWGDSNWNTGNWIDTPTKHGFITVPSFAKGKTWYQSSSFALDGHSYEIQVFDPDGFGEVIGGTRPAWNVKPTNRWEITLPGYGAVPDGGSDPWGAVAGACFDPVGKRLYLYCPQMPSAPYDSTIFVFAVDC